MVWVKYDPDYADLPSDWLPVTVEGNEWSPEHWVIDICVDGHPGWSLLDVELQRGYVDVSFL